MNPALAMLAKKTPAARARAIKRLGGPDSVRAHWPLWAMPGQVPPPGDWRTWLIMAGRGFGKTRAGAEWVRSLVELGSDIRIALVGATPDEMRRVMIEGESGLLSVGLPGGRPRWEPSRGRLVWPNGAQAFVYSGSNPDGLRGAQHHFVWCDELAKWAHPSDTWANVQLGLRLGLRPRALITTTPRPIAVLKTLLARGDVAVTRGATTDNLFLPTAFTKAVVETYGGTRFGRQEIDGDLIDESEGALWTRAVIEASRVKATPKLRRVVIGVDPPAGIGRDACGIVAVGLGSDGIGYVLSDASVTGLAPEGWAAAVARAAAEFGADRVIAEANNGGAMVESVLRAAEADLPVTLVHAVRGKSERAEPVSMLYARGRVKHVGAFPMLEDELCGLIMGGGYDGPGRSPDRADALVWALTALMVKPQAGVPRVRVV